MYALSTNAKLSEIGRMSFFAGLLAFLLTFPGPTANVSNLISDIRRRSGARGTLEIAKQKDAQSAPYPDWQE